MAKKDIIKIKTPVFRVAFPFVFEPSSYDGGNEKYSLCAIWTPSQFGKKDKERWQELRAELDRVSRDAFKTAWKDLGRGYNIGLRDGKEKADVEGFGDGTYFATLSTQVKPGIVDIQGNDITSKDEFYPGVYAQGTVNIYSYNNKSKGVAIGLRNLLKVKDGPRLDGRGSASGDFDPDDIDESWLEEHTDSLLNDDSGDDF
jgi:hypothetical protein